MNKEDKSLANTTNPAYEPSTVGNIEILSGLIKSVEDWAVSKGINKINPKHGRIPQIRKMNEEAQETLESAAVLDALDSLEDNFQKTMTKEKEYDKFVDGLGDVFVTLIIACQQNNIRLEDALYMAYNEIKHRKGTTEGGQFIKASNEPNELEGM